MLTFSGAKLSSLERVLAPRLLLVGVAASFLACCVAGRLLSHVNCLCDFTRFHLHIDYQSLYYPTVSQVRSLARDTLDPDKVVVVLGGNSILQGFGQGAAGNWTRHLQELLGDRFQVLNLALPNAAPFEFGAVAAEVLARDHPRLLLLSHTTWPLTRSVIPTAVRTCVTCTGRRDRGGCWRTARNESPACDNWRKSVANRSASCSARADWTPA